MAPHTYVFVLFDAWKKYHHRKLQRVKTILGTSTSKMQQPNLATTASIAMIRGAI